MLRDLLTQHGLGAYADAFEAHHVQVSDLAHLSDEDLRLDFGLVSYVDRKRFRGLVAGLASVGAPPAAGVLAGGAGATRVDVPPARAPAPPPGLPLSAGATRVDGPPAMAEADAPTGPGFGGAGRGATVSYPERMGSYRILGVLGAGGMGTVLRARHMEEEWARQQGGDVALKLIHGELSSSVEFRSRFIREALLGRRLSHPGLVSVYEVVTEGPHLGLVMALVLGEPLSARVRRGGLGLREVLEVVGPLGETLDHLHGSGVVHRDVKPGNIVMGKDGRPVLLDLGIAKDGSVEGASHQTRALTALGTSGWMAPEQVDAVGVTGAADRYALGLVSYALLSGELPWSGEESEAQVLVRKATGRLRRLSEVRSGLPEHVERAVSRMLSALPEGRYESCAAFVSALERDEAAAAREAAAREAAAWQYAGADGVAVAAGLSGVVSRVLASPEGWHRVWRPGMPAWAQWSEVAEVSAAVDAARPAPPLPSPVPVPVPPQPPPVPRAAGARRRVEGRAAGAFSFEMAYIAPGAFTMGSPPSEEGRGGDETQHRVVLTRGFELGVVPVTQSLYAAVLGTTPSHFQGPQRPVEFVSWFDAVRFCNALSAAVGLSPAYRIGAGEKPSVKWDRASPGYRLPTEAEWEYAARAGTSHRFAGGDDARAVAWTEENSGGETRAVGEKAANALGLHDLSGNVWEWCWDWYGAYPSEPVSDAAGPASGSERVLRGGSWGVSARLARVACRGDASPPGLCLANIGLRLARTVP